MGKEWKQCQTFIFWVSKIAADGDFSHEIKRCLVLGRKAVTNLDSILKSREIMLLTKVHSVGFSSSHVWMWELNHKVEHQRIDAFNCYVGEDSWEKSARRSNQSIIKEISPEYSLEGLMLKLKLRYFGHLNGKSQIIRKAPDAGTDWRQEEKEMTEDEMVGWHHQLDWPESEQAPGVGDGQRSLSCFSPWGCKESDMTEQLNWTDWTELNLYTEYRVCY